MADWLDEIDKGRNRPQAAAGKGATVASTVGPASVRTGNTATGQSADWLDEIDKSRNPRQVQQERQRQIEAARRQTQY